MTAVGEGFRMYLVLAMNTVLFISSAYLIYSGIIALIKRTYKAKWFDYHYTFTGRRAIVHGIIMIIFGIALYLFEVGYLGFLFDSLTLRYFQ